MHTSVGVAPLHMDWTTLLRRWGRVTAGILLVLVGIVGIVLPIIPGVLPILGGLALLAPESPLVQRLLDRFKALAGNLGSNRDTQPDSD